MRLPNRIAGILARTSGLMLLTVAPVAAQRVLARDLGTLGGQSSAANGVNSRGEVVGNSETPDGQSHAFLWQPMSGLRDLGTLGGESSFAAGINDSVQVVGFAETEEGLSHAFLWTAANGMADLGTLGGLISQATA